tara:strand:- start:16434 stop:16865 length:432 start_codon:yes stop_codon:yes gene_type:complete
MSEEENTRTVGNANPVCSSGRSTGTPGTRHGKIYKESLRFSKPLLLGTANIGGVGKNRKPYKSYWRLRKEARSKNKEDFENGKNTPSTDMMRKFGIKVGNNKFQKYEGKGTVQVEWVRKNDAAYRPKKGSYDYGFTYTDTVEE